MANSIGARAVAYANGYDLSTYLSQTDLDHPADAVDTTGYQNVARTFIPGLKNQTMTITGYYDASSASSIDTVLRGMIGGTAMWTVYEQGDALGNRGHSCYGFETDYKVSAPVAGAVTVSASVQGSVGMGGLVSLAQKQTFGFAAAGTTATTAVDFGTSLSDAGGTTSSHGLFSYLQVFSGSNTGNITVNVQHGTAAVTGQATLVSHTTFAANTAPTYERVSVATGTTINEFLRVTVVASAAGTVSLNLGVARLF